MAKGVKIDFDTTIDFDEISTDLRIGIFPTELANGRIVPLKVEISNEEDDLIPNVYNLAFGPMDDRGELNDAAQLEHKNYSSVFSTILFGGLTYLKTNPEHFLGVDGSSNSRALLYWRYLQQNFNYLNQFFRFFGIKYYVRISRFGKRQYDNPFDFEDILPYADPITKTNQWPDQMYNYFIFRLKNKARLNVP
jgi:hypothetical protein